MWKSTLQGAAAAAMAVAMAGVVHANADDDHARGCSDATLRGLYVFNASGFNIVAGVSQPKAVVEFIRFNGDGTLTVPAATASINGVIIRSPPDGPGIYSVGADCTGTVAFGPPGPTFDLFVAPRGSEVYMNQTGGAVPGVLQGTAERLSR